MPIITGPGITIGLQRQSRFLPLRSTDPARSAVTVDTFTTVPVPGSGTTKRWHAKIIQNDDDDDAKLSLDDLDLLFCSGSLVGWKFVEYGLIICWCMDMNSSPAAAAAAATAQSTANAGSGSGPAVSPSMRSRSRQRLYDQLFAADDDSAPAVEMDNAKCSSPLPRSTASPDTTTPTIASFGSAPTDEEDGLGRAARRRTQQTVPFVQQKQQPEYTMHHFGNNNNIQMEPNIRGGGDTDDEYDYSTINLHMPTTTMPSSEPPHRPETAAATTPFRGVSVGGGITRPTNAANNNTNSSWGGGGGRLWRLAGRQVAAKAALLLEKQQVGQQWTETFLRERMRSRADPNGPQTPPTPPRPAPNLISAQPILLKMTSSNHSDDDFQEEEAFLIMNTGLAHKRVRVVQLLIIGLVGILMAWLGNFFVSSSCHFASIPVSVGQYGDVYPLHFGLWNYSPVDSALNGYKYCYPYNSKNSNSNSGSSHQGEAPVLSRIFNLSALLAGTFSLTVLWIYLISGRIISKFWKAAVFAATTAGILQMVTPLIFFTTSQLCRSAQCSVGPAAALSAVTAVAWVIVAAELHYHCPVVGTAGTVQESGSGVDEKTAAIMSTTNNEGLESRNLSHGSDATTPVAQLEMSDLANASHEYFDRFQYTRSSLRQYRPPDMSELS